ncbi:MAG: hypothetical protein AAF205_00255 [Pseudomonadota bacterium]
MVDFGAITGAITSLNAIAELAKNIRETKDEKLASDKFGELTMALLEALKFIRAAEDEYTALRRELADLKQQVAEIDTFAAEAANYELTDVERGALVYALKETATPMQPPHWLCASCYQKSKKSILQRDSTPIKDTRQIFYRCNECGSKISVDRANFPGSGYIP